MWNLANGGKPHTKKIPMRSCAGCGEKKEKKELIRVIRTPEGEIVVDFSGKKNGRGVYLCDNLKCLKTAIKKKSLERSLNVSIPSEVYTQLEKEMVEGGV